MNFEVQFKAGAIRGDIIGNNNKNSKLLFLHGAGKANRDRFFDLRKKLYGSFDITSVAFDYLGHGESSVNKLQDSIESRLEQVEIIISDIYKYHPISIIASSMSAYIAIKLTVLYKIQNLILFVPAVYNKNVYRVPFSEEFTKMIRRESNWVNSDAWDIIQSYRGNLLIINAENDEVVPSEIAKYLYDLAINAKMKKNILIPESSHQILNFINSHPDFIDIISMQIQKLVCE